MRAYFAGGALTVALRTAAFDEVWATAVTACAIARERSTTGTTATRASDRTLRMLVLNHTGYQPPAAARGFDRRSKELRKIPCAGRRALLLSDPKGSRPTSGSSRSARRRAGDRPG